MDLQKIKAFTFDVDGVLTDGGIYCFPDGDFIRKYDAKDGFSMRVAKLNGYGLGIITGGHSETIRKRLTKSGVALDDFYLLSNNKIHDFHDYCERHGYTPDEVMYIGDDLPDIPLIKAAGIGVCPCDAAEEAKEAADYVSPFPGGKGCVRDAVQMVLRAQGKWIFDVEKYAESWKNVK